jgi:tetratricopeptide (TPR) repeat protein
VAALSFVVFVALAVAALVLQISRKTGAEPLATVAAMSGALSALAGVISAMAAVRSSWQSHGADRRDITSAHLMRDDHLVDRGDEMQKLIAGMNRSRVINCHGQRGAGKSFLLEHLADVINGHRVPAHGHPHPTQIGAALYFDLADAVGFDMMRAQICQATLGDASSSWGQFVTYVRRVFTGRKVLLILDNANSPGVWPELGEAAYQFLAARPSDALMLGSIDPIVLSNLVVERVGVSRLDVDAVTELLIRHAPELNAQEIDKLYEQCDGLPLYARLISASRVALRDGGPTSTAEAVIDRQILPELPSETRVLMAYVALLGLTRRQVKVAELHLCPIPNLEANLAVTERLSLVSPVPQDRIRLIKVHDLVRDAALRGLTDEVSEAALMLFERAWNRNRSIDAAIMAMFADPAEVGPDRFDEVTRQVFGSAVASRNHALLSTMHERASQHGRVLAFIASDPERHDLFCFARASELAGYGQYVDAQQALDASSITQVRPGRGPRAPGLESELRFLQADIAHLQNRYDEAASMFSELEAWAEESGDLWLRARCVWGHAHVLRHQGSELEVALAQFARAVELASGTGELFAHVYSITGATGVKVYLDAVPADEEAILEEAERRIAIASKHDSYMFEVWKSQAQVAWSRGNTPMALEIVETAIARALAMNDRLLYNLYFERAELRRDASGWGDALEDYGRVLAFGEGNRDRNLIANAQLGMVATELAAGSWLRHASASSARADTLRARDIARAADINATASIAERLVIMIDQLPADRGSPPRLVLF